MLSIAVLSFSFGYYYNQIRLNKDSISTSTISSPVPTTLNPLGFITNIKTSRGTVYLLIDQENVYVDPFEITVNNSKYITIKKDDYPKLFEQGVANSSALRAEEYIDPQNKNEFIKVSNNQPDHGGVKSTYVLLINLFTGEIKEGKNDYSI